MALAYMGIFGTAIAFVWFYDGVITIGPARSMVFVNLVPLFAIAFAMLLLGETLELSMVAGAALVIAGVFIINRPDRAEPAAVHRRRRGDVMLLTEMQQHIRDTMRAFAQGELAPNAARWDRERPFPARGARARWGRSARSAS